MSFLKKLWLDAPNPLTPLSAAALNDLEARIYGAGDSPAAFRVKRSTTQSIASGSPVKVQFDSETFDPQALYDPTTNFRATPGRTGFWAFQTYLDPSDTVTANTYMIADLYRNGALDSRIDIDMASTTTNNLAVAGASLVQVSSSNDYFEIFVTHNYGSARLISANCRFEGFRLGP